MLCESVTIILSCKRVLAVVITAHSSYSDVVQLLLLSGASAHLADQSGELTGNSWGIPGLVLLHTLLQGAFRYIWPHGRVIWR